MNYSQFLLVFTCMYWESNLDLVTYGPGITLPVCLS